MIAGARMLAACAHLDLGGAHALLGVIKEKVDIAGHACSGADQHHMWLPGVCVQLHFCVIAALVLRTFSMPPGPLCVWHGGVQHDEGALCA